MHFYTPISSVLAARKALFLICACFSLLRLQYLSSPLKRWNTSHPAFFVCFLPLCFPLGNWTWIAPLLPQLTLLSLFIPICFVLFFLSSVVVVPCCVMSAVGSSDNPQPSSGHCIDGFISGNNQTVHNTRPPAAHLDWLTKGTVAASLKESPVSLKQNIISSWCSSRSLDFVVFLYLESTLVLLLTFQIRNLLLLSKNSVFIFTFCILCHLNF